MGRPPRVDGPGMWHHVMNRGIARRTTFEGLADFDAFTEALLRVTRGGWMEVHVYSAMFNHFHLLVRTERGTVSEGMRRLESTYVRVFNRMRDRDGALFRGRFTSRAVTSEAYWYTVLRYIDRNPVAAGLAREPTEYPHGSAWWYARRAGPAWLRRDVVEAAVSADAGRQVTSASGRRNHFISASVSETMRSRPALGWISPRITPAITSRCWRQMRTELPPVAIA